VCVMRVEEGLDTGPVYACETTPIAGDESAGELRSRLAEMGSDLLVRTLPEIPDREPVPQAGEPTYASKLEVDEFRLDPNRPAPELARLVRAGNPRPGAWLVVDGTRVKVLRARALPARGGAPGTLRRPGELVTTDGILGLDEVEPEGKRTMAAEAWMNGLRARELPIDRP
jgi:methionyl-tRNA formyltransferase